MDDVRNIARQLMSGEENRLHNYIIPGLTSDLLAVTAKGGKMRLFTMERDQEYEVAVHDHRYDFSCMVLKGAVKNILYSATPCDRANASHAMVPYSEHHHSVDESLAKFVKVTMSNKVYNEGEWYGMSHVDFHRIQFSKGSQVLFIEGPNRKKESNILLPYQNERICNTFLWADWMMKR